ncbi:rhodanese-like domain-containing protein [Paracrocinitomix mangrovi]|uniref:rhodanese-like domain-containing protein n=1 Tax=Paracrocinitomix mangrovi TaxID=2862509 RepID=UPI001C8D5A53|nr:rhodanese-like domain-containing protein [Paracrocinitomix mangrovi]UKN01862.1 rhodanese-like domain-containing protein [Paracrocinitomix mangrovi]
MGLLGSLLGRGSGAAAELLKDGAVIIDVRTPGEFQGGHVKGAKNIPLQEIQKRENEIMNIGKPVVFCCASGGRSGQATSYFKSKGLNCENGGGWMQVNGMV